MKTKIIRTEGVQSLVVDDELINSQCQYGSPITLAVISHYFNTGCWSYKDYRLKNNLMPSHYLDDSSQQIYNFKDYSQEDKNLVLSKLTHYTITDEEGLFYWRNDGIDLNGDIPKNDKQRLFPNGKEYPPSACFTFKAAQKKLKEAKEFWEQYDGSLTNENIRIPNPHLQPHSADYYFELSFNKKKLEQFKQHNK